MTQSFSKLDTYGKCPKLYEYKYIRNLQAKRQDSNLFRGITAHDMLRDWFITQRTFGIGVPPHQFISRWITMYWQDHKDLDVFADVLFDQQKEVEQMGKYVQRFLELGLWDTWEVLHVEEEFSIEINGKKLTFTPDLVLRDPDGIVWIVDHKTTGKKISRDALDIRPQALLYYAGVSQFYENVGGFIFNYIRKKVPAQPRLNKTGKLAVNDVMRLDTDYQTLYDFCQSHRLLDDPLHRRRLAELRDEDTFFFQHPFYITPEMVDEAVKDFDSRYELVEASIRTERFPRTIQPFNGCKSCDFQAICFTELTCGNTAVVLQFYEPREEKNPYEREEDD